MTRHIARTDLPGTRPYFGKPRNRTTFAGEQLNTSVSGFVTRRSTEKPDGVAWIMVKHSPAGASALPGCDGACMPPPVQLLTARALSRMQVRVSREPQALADSAKSSHADQ